MRDGTDADVSDLCCGSERRGDLDLDIAADLIGIDGICWLFLLNPASVGFDKLEFNNGTGG